MLLRFAPCRASETFLPLRTADHDRRNYLRSRCGSKMAFLDDRVARGATDEDMQPEAWEEIWSIVPSHVNFLMPVSKIFTHGSCMFQEILDAHRVRAAAVGLGIRPRRFFKPTMSPVDGVCEAEMEGSPDPRVQASNAGPSYMSTNVKYLELRHAHGVQGVLQLHQAHL